MEQVPEHKLFGIKEELLNSDFIAGIIVGHGSFYWTKAGSKMVPCFALKMQINEFDLLVNIKYSLGLHERVYEYQNSGRHFGLLLVRSFAGLRIMIEQIYPKLRGHKRKQFAEWFKGFEGEGISEKSRAIRSIYKNEFPELYL